MFTHSLPFALAAAVLTVSGQAHAVAPFEGPRDLSCIFDRCDQNRDGVIDQWEFEQGLRHLAWNVERFRGTGQAFQQDALPPGQMPPPCAPRMGDGFRYGRRQGPQADFDRCGSRRRPLQEGYRGPPPDTRRGSCHRSCRGPGTGPSAESEHRYQHQTCYMVPNGPDRGGWDAACRGIHDKPYCDSPDMRNEPRPFRCRLQAPAARKHVRGQVEKHQRSEAIEDWADRDGRGKPKAKCEAKHRKHAKARAKRWLSRFDTDRDGCITFEEFNRGMKKTFRALDRNGDGRLGRKELIMCPPGQRPENEEKMRRGDQGKCKAEPKTSRVRCRRDPQPGGGPWNLIDPTDAYSAALRGETSGQRCGVIRANLLPVSPRALLQTPLNGETKFGHND
ncbi:MAG: EF-hand domain-containing protein [Phycisphaerae bacterium]|nr:EF-hand domain-containing protein [Phycisphaerae bacterium]